jgi:hypothetical protein
VACRNGARVISVMTKVAGSPKQKKVATELWLAAQGLCHQTHCLFFNIIGERGIARGRYNIVKLLQPTNSLSNSRLLYCYMDANTVNSEAKMA